MNTTENNKIIAEFLESKYENHSFTNKEGEFIECWLWSKPCCGYPKSIGIGELSTAWQIGNFHFHDDWNWLMEVVEKCLIGEAETDRPDLINAIYDGLTNINKTETLNSCFEFIKWFNQQNIKP